MAACLADSLQEHSLHHQFFLVYICTAYVWEKLLVLGDVWCWELSRRSSLYWRRSGR